MGLVTRGRCLFLVLVGAIAHAGEAPVQPPYSWRGIGGTGVFPAGDLVTSFRDVPAGFPLDKVDKKAARSIPRGVEAGMRTNICWRTTLPHWGHNAPVVMADRVFLLCEEGWKSDCPQVVCLSAVDGKILWQGDVDHLDAWPDARRQEAKQARAREFKRWREHMTWWNRLWWNNDTNQPANHAKEAWEKIRAEALAAGWTFPAHGEHNPKVGHPRGREGLRVGKTSGEPVDASLVKNFHRCIKERIYWREGWLTYPNWWYGSTMGSVVGDGRCVYTVTALGGAAAYDLEGNRLWVADLGVKPGGGAHSPPANFSIASPALAGDTLVFFHRDAATMYGLDTATGEIRWRTVSPAYGEGADAKPGYLRLDFKPRGYHAHMAPGGTPVIMALPDGAGKTAVAVSGHGMVVRVEDGKLLGQVAFTVAETWLKKGKPVKRSGSETERYGGGYNSWTARGDVIYATHFRGWFAASRLAVEGDSLRQEQLWLADGKGGNRGSNVTVHGDHVYWGPRFSRLQTDPKRKPESLGYSAFDAATGRHVHGKGRVGLGYNTGQAFAGAVMVARTGGWHMHGQPTPIFCSFSISSLPDLKQIGDGFLACPKPEGEILERHIAFKGWPYASWGVQATVAWGNRIFIRNNDYLWCIGDPKKPWVPPERYLAGGR